MSANRKLKLAYPVKVWEGGDTSDGYQIIEVHNSTEYNPGDLLSKRTVSRLCFENLYEVNIVRKKDR